MSNLKAKIDMLIAQISDIEAEYDLNQENEANKEFRKYVMPLDDMARELRGSVGRRVANES